MTKRAAAASHKAALPRKPPNIKRGKTLPAFAPAPRQSADSPAAEPAALPAAEPAAAQTAAIKQQKAKAADRSEAAKAAEFVRGAATAQNSPLHAPPAAHLARSAAAKSAAEAMPSFRGELLSLLPNLRAFAVSLCGSKDRADDLLQDTIMRAWAKQDSFTLGTNMKAWLFTILRNEFFSQMRRQGREVQDTDSVFANNVAVQPAQYGSLDLQDFKLALEKLPADQREAIILIGASGFSYEEAASICHCALGTIKSRVSRARARLQILLEMKEESSGAVKENPAAPPEF